MSEVERYETEEADALIKKKIIKPARNVIECMRGVKGLFAKHQEFDQYLKNFKMPVKKVEVKKERIVEPLKFDPRLDMGNIYWGYSARKLDDPVLQGGRRKFGQTTWGPAKTFFTCQGEDIPIINVMIDNSNKKIDSNDESRKRSSSNKSISAQKDKLAEMLFTNKSQSVRIKSNLPAAMNKKISRNIKNTHNMKSIPEIS